MIRGKKYQLLGRGIDRYFSQETCILAGIFFDAMVYFFS